jgi:hypothetical protein
MAQANGVQHENLKGEINNEKNEKGTFMDRPNGLRFHFYGVHHWIVDE